MNWCERSVGVINTYATVLRRQAAEYWQTNHVLKNVTLLKCEKVLSLGGKQLVRFKEMVYCDDDVHHGSDIEFLKSIDCLKQLTYKYFLIKHNLLIQTNRARKTNKSELRFLIEYEFDNHYNKKGKIQEESAKRSSKILDTLRLRHTKESYATLSDKDIKRGYLTTMQQDLGCMYTYDSQMCGECGVFEVHADKETEIKGKVKGKEKAEAGSGTKFKKCGRCLTEVYCSLECQHAAWKQHKILCNKATKNEI